MSTAEYCGIPVQYIALFIGLFQIILGGLGFFIGVFLIYNLTQNDKLITTIITDLNHKLHPEITSGQNDSFGETFFPLLCNLTVFLTILFLLNFIIGCILFHGIRKNRASLLKAWITIQMALVTLLLIATSSYLLREGNLQSVGLFGISYLIGMNNIKVVYMLYIQMLKSEIDPGKPLEI